MIQPSSTPDTGFSMLHFLLPVFALSLLIGSFAPARAQDQDLGDKSRRLELAREMNTIRPARAQVDEAVQAVSRNLEPLERERLLNLVERAFDYTALEKLSVETTAELFSVAELEKMVAYFGSPEAKAIATKLNTYQERIQPEILKMLDRALMIEKTGGPGDVPVAAPAP